MKLTGDDFDFAAGEIGIRLLARDDLAFDGDDVFAADVFGFAVRFGLRLFVEDDLNDAGAIANVEEEEIAEVATARDPAHDDGVFIGVGGAEIAAVVCAGEVAEEIEHDGRCPLLERAGADLLYLAAREFAAFAELQLLRRSEIAEMVD